MDEYKAWAVQRHEQCKTPLALLEVDGYCVDWEFAIGCYNYVMPDAPEPLTGNELVHSIKKVSSGQVVQLPDGFKPTLDDVGAKWVIKKNYHEDTAEIYNTCTRRSQQCAGLFDQQAFGELYSRGFCHYIPLESLIHQTSQVEAPGGRSARKAWTRRTSSGRAGADSSPAAGSAGSSPVAVAVALADSSPGSAGSPGAKGQPSQLVPAAVAAAHAAEAECIPPEAAGNAGGKDQDAPMPPQGDGAEDVDRDILGLGQE
eukprot:3109942-Lingulodinium_polyedra.AAC.1